MYLFLKVYSLLKPRGLFILEYQEWKSYQRKAHYTEGIAETFQGIRIHPEQFVSVLQKIGMQLVSNRKVSSNTELEHSETKGFNRPIAVFRKVGKELAFDMREVTLENMESFVSMDAYVEVVWRVCLYGTSVEWELLDSSECKSVDSSDRKSSESTEREPLYC